MIDSPTHYQAPAPQLRQDTTAFNYMDVPQQRPYKQTLRELVADKPKKAKRKPRK